MAGATAHRPIRVAIDAQVLPWRSGGLAHALLALVRGFGRLDDNMTYTLLVGSDEEEAFWRPQVAGNQTLVRVAEHRSTTPGPRSWSPGALMRPLLRPFARRVRERLAIDRNWPEVPLSDGFYESLGCDVLHLPSQRFVICSIPTVYNPHDIQHVHFPQFFTPREIAWRETVYPVGCKLAQSVVVGSSWAKHDLVRHYQLDPDKVQVVVEGASSEIGPPVTESMVRTVRERYGLPDTFVLYPAMTWPHKNHLGLLEALAALRDERGLAVSAVFTGSQRPSFWPTIEARIRELRLEPQIHALGFVPEEHLRVIQQLATALVQPSLFEASSLPIFDAWRDGVPVACSRATALPEQVQDAGILFDPNDVHEQANAIATLLTSATTRADLRARGYRRLGDFSWDRAAMAYRALYRRAARVPLTDEDQWALASDGQTGNPSLRPRSEPASPEPVRA